MNNYICRILLNVSHAAICVSRVRTDLRVVGPRTTIYVSNTTRYVLNMHTTICVSCFYLFVSPQDWWSSGGASFFFACIHVFFFARYVPHTSAYVSVSPLMNLRTNARVVGLYFAVLQLHTSIRRADSPWARYNIYIYTLYNICIYMCVCVYIYI